MYFSFTDRRGLWIGLQQEDPMSFNNHNLQTKTQSWKWSDNSPVRYENWASHNNKSDAGPYPQCGLYSTLDGKWIALNCSFRFTYLCELTKMRTTGKNNENAK